MREWTPSVVWSRCLHFDPVLGRWAERGPPHRLGVYGQVCDPLGINSCDPGAPVPDLSSPVWTPPRILHGVADKSQKRGSRLAGGGTAVLMRSCLSRAQSHDMHFKEHLNCKAAQHAPPAPLLQLRFLTARNGVGPLQLW